MQSSANDHVVEIAKSIQKWFLDVPNSSPAL